LFWIQALDPCPPNCIKIIVPKFREAYVEIKTAVLDPLVLAVARGFVRLDLIEAGKFKSIEA